ncbi:MAG: TonB-dependent receptor plug domain-containing protein, partial [Steroidobacteraceae bacterium]
MGTRHNAISLAVAIALGAGPSAASAQLLDEIIVTATKREESIQAVAISVSAIGGEEIAELGLSDMTDITQQVPGLQLNTWSPQLTIFNLRGVSQNNFVDNL